mmetsp:Transcript_5372/g.11913  ORF Transcript_5372/g.11913 Transcript_5372/m.11913 type:complete len:101 (+) Transcript_5372:464-766(+)
MSNEENGKHADIVNSEPLVGSLGGESGGGGEDGGDGSGGDGGEGFEGLGLGGGTEGGLDDGACLRRNKGRSRCEKSKEGKDSLHHLDSVCLVGNVGGFGW